MLCDFGQARTLEVDCTATKSALQSIKSALQSAEVALAEAQSKVAEYTQLQRKVQILQTSLDEATTAAADQAGRLDALDTKLAASADALTTEKALFSALESQNKKHLAANVALKQALEESTVAREQAEGALTGAAADATNTQIHELENKINHLKEEYYQTQEKLQTEVLADRERVDEFEEESLCHQARLLDKDGEIARLAQQLAQAGTERDEAQTERDHAEEERDLLGDSEEELSAMQSQIASLKMVLASSTVEASKVMAAYDEEHKEQLRALTNENKRLCAASADPGIQATEVGALKEALAASELQLQQVSAEVKETTAAANAMTAELAVKGNEIVTLTESVAQLLDRLGGGQLELEEQLNTITAERDALVKERDAMKKKFSDGYLTSPEEKAALLDEHALKYNKAMETAAEDRQKALTSEEEARIATHEKQLQHGEDQIQISSLSSRAENLQTKLTVMEGRVTELTKEGQTAAALFAQLADLEEEIVELKENLEDSAAEVTELRAEVEDVKRKAQEEIERRTGDMGKKLDKMTAEKDHFQDLYDETTKKLGDTEELLRVKTKALEVKETECKMLKLGVKKADAMHQKQLNVLQAGIDTYQKCLIRIGETLGIDLVIEESEIDVTQFDPTADEAEMGNKWQSEIDTPLAKIDEQVGLLNQKMQELEQNVRAVRAEEAKEKAKLKKKYETYISKMKEKLDRKEGVLKCANEELQDHKKKLKAKVQKDENEEAEKQRLIGDNSRYRESLDQQRTEINKLRCSLTDEMQLKDALSKRVELRKTNMAPAAITRSEVYNELQSTKEQLKKTKETWKVKMVAKNALLTELRTSLAERDDELELTKAHLELAQEREEAEAAGSGV